MNGSKRYKKECANPSGISSLSKEILLEKDLREQAAEIISNRKLGEGEKIANIYKLVNYYRDNFGYPVNPEDDGASGRSCFCVNLQGKTGNKEYEMQFLKGDIRLAEKGTADASVSFLKMSGREKHDILATRIGLGNPYPQEFKQHFFELINEAIQADKADRKENVIRKRTRSGYKTITTEEERRVHFNIGKLKCSALSLGDGRYEIKCAGQRFSIDERKKMDANLQKLYNLGRSNNGNVIARVSEKAIDEKEYLVNYLNTHGTKSRDGSTVVLLPMPGKRNRFVTVSEKDGEITCGADMSASGAKRILNMMQKETDISDIASSMRAEENSFGVNVRDVNLDSTKDEFDISKKINETKTVFLNRQDTIDMQRNIELGLGSLAKGNISTEDYCAYVCKLATDNGNIVEFTTGKDLFSTDKSTGSHVCTYYIIPKKSGEPAYMKRDRTETRCYGKDGKVQLTVSKRDAIASKEEFLDAIDKIQRNVIVENGDPMNSLKKEVERLTSQFQENVGSGMDDLAALNMLKEGLEKYKETINENRDAASRAIRKSFRIVHGESESAIDLQSENNRLENSNGIVEAERDSRSGVPQRNVGGER